MTDKEIIIDGVDVSECEKLGETIDGITCGLGKRIRFANKIITKHNLCKNNPNCYYKQLKRKEQECEELKKELQAQRDFTAHEQKLIYCVAYDETCKTGNDCKQEKCIFKDNIKLKQTLADIEFWVREFLKRTGQVVPNEIMQILQKISEVENGR